VKTLLAVCIAALGLSAASTDLVKVNLPAPVMVGGVELPSGECTIQEMSSGGNVVLLVRSKTGQQSAVLANRLSEMQEGHTSVVLSRQEGRYTLDQVWLGDDKGFQILGASGE
jgi:hypothetical protein